MRRFFIFVVVFVCCVPTLRAQSPASENKLAERIHITTDKDNYLSGEIVWMKLLTTDPEGVPLTFSKVGYVELIGEDESLVKERIEIRSGIGEGTLVIPSTLPTGWYRLAGYTRWMRNEGPEVFFEKLVGVVNPALAEVPRGSDRTTTEQPQPNTVTSQTGTALPQAGGLKVSTDLSLYSPRSEVKLEISGIPEGLHNLGVSVTSADPVGGFAKPSLEAWKGMLHTGSSPVLPAPADRIEAEYEGAVVTGKLVSTDTGEAAYSSDILPLASFTGDRIDLFSGSLDRNGTVVFRTKRVAGFDDIVTSMRGNRERPYRIDLDDPFSQTQPARSLPAFPLEKIDRQATLRQSLAMQLQYSYVNDLLNRESRTAPRFTQRPDQSYKMEEWRRFATMHEVVTEFVQMVRFSRIDRKWHLTVINRDFINAQVEALVLLDGIPIMDHDIIYNYNPLLLDRIEVYYDRYIFGDNLFFGIVAFYTANNSYPELQPDPFTQILSYPSPQARRMFYAPDYSDPDTRKSRVPDYRHTLYWDPEIAANGNGHAEVSFFTSDLTGSYQVLVEGITASGEPLSAVCTIEVR